jgi:hypothetical protein
MKPSRTFIITCFGIICIVLISILIEHHFRKESLESRHKEIRFYIEKIEDYKKELKKSPDEAVTKADLAAFTEMNYYQSQIDKLYMENEFELSKGYTAIFPDYFFLLMILWLSFQLDKIYKQIQPVSIIKHLNEDELLALKAKSMKSSQEKETEG